MIEKALFNINFVCHDYAISLVRFYSFHSFVDECPVGGVLFTLDDMLVNVLIDGSLKSDRSLE